MSQSNDVDLELAALEAEMRVGSERRALPSPRAVCLHSSGTQHQPCRRSMCWPPSRCRRGAGQVSSANLRRPSCLKGL